MRSCIRLNELVLVCVLLCFVFLIPMLADFFFHHDVARITDCIDFFMLQCLRSMRQRQRLERGINIFVVRLHA